MPKKFQVPVTPASGLTDTGEREVASSGMMREPHGDRPRFELLWPEGVPYEHQLLTRFAVHMAKGAQKYAPRQWEVACTPAEIERYKSSLLRHVAEFVCDKTDDGEDHAAAILFNVLAAVTAQYRYNATRKKTSIADLAIERAYQEARKENRLPTEFEILQHLTKLGMVSS